MSFAVPSLQECFRSLREATHKHYGVNAANALLFSLLDEVLAKLNGSDEDGGIAQPIAIQLAELVLFLCAKLHEFRSHVHLSKYQVSTYGVPHFVDYTCDTICMDHWQKLLEHCCWMSYLI
jgi:hypothetical protein